MNNIDKQYQALLKDILENGVKKEDRTGTGTVSVFGRQIRHKMSEGFPLLTTKKMPFKLVAAELLWFLRGDTNIKFLLDYNCHIWDGDAYKNFTKQVSDIIDGYKCGDIMGMQSHIEAMFSDSDKLIPLTQEEFINKIKTDDKFATQWGDLGPIYGKQWRKWETDDIDAPRYEHYKKDIDQIQNLINDLKTNPDSRRLMVSAWNVSELDQMVLPPCHYGFQVYTRKLSFDERYAIYSKSSKTWEEGGGNAYGKISGLDMMDEDNVPTRAVSLMWNQRSVDTFLGLPFNIASYGLLLEIIAREVNMVPEELIGNLGDVHLYSNHLEQAKMQALRKPYKLPTLEITERNWYPHEKVKEHVGEKDFNDKIMSYRPDSFSLIGYDSHSGIKAPLSN
jgi:thymidylate synthase